MKRKLHEDYCVAMVHDTERGCGFHQCGRKRGHGPDGKYCKQHARKHVPDSEKVRLYGAWIGYSGRAEIAEVYAVETDKLYLIPKSHGAIGYAHRLEKGDAHLTPDAAVDAAIKIRRVKIRNAQATIDRLKSEIQKLNNIPGKRKP